MRRYLLGAVFGAALVAAVVSFPRVRADVRERALSCDMLKARQAAARSLVEKYEQSVFDGLHKRAPAFASESIRELAEAVSAQETMRALAEVRGCDIIAKSPGERL